MPLVHVSKYFIFKCLEISFKGPYTVFDVEKKTLFPVNYMMFAILTDYCLQVIRIWTWLLFWEIFSFLLSLPVVVEDWLKKNWLKNDHCSERQRTLLEMNIWPPPHTVSPNLHFILSQETYGYNVNDYHWVLRLVSFKMSQSEWYKCLISK